MGFRESIASLLPTYWNSRREGQADLTGSSHISSLPFKLFSPSQTSYARHQLWCPSGPRLLTAGPRPSFSPAGRGSAGEEGRLVQTLLWGRRRRLCRLSQDREPGLPRGRPVGLPHQYRRAVCRHQGQPCRQHPQAGPRQHRHRRVRFSTKSHN